MIGIGWRVLDVIAVDDLFWRIGLNAGGLAGIVPVVMRFSLSTFLGSHHLNLVWLGRVALRAHLELGRPSRRLCEAGRRRHHCPCAKRRF